MLNLGRNKEGNKVSVTFFYLLYIVVSLPCLFFLLLFWLVVSLSCSCCKFTLFLSYLVLVRKFKFFFFCSGFSSCINSNFRKLSLNSWMAYVLLAIGQFSYSNDLLSKVATSSLILLSLRVMHLGMLYIFFLG